jgi:SAM-dependent methyltransferase
MIYETMKHKCFLCGRDLDRGLILWDKTIKSSDEIDSKYILDNSGKMIHGKTVMCLCGLAQEYEPMTIRSLNQFYQEVDGISEYRKIYPIPEGAIRLHILNTLGFVFSDVGDNVFSSNHDKLQVLIVGSGDVESIELIEHHVPKAEVFTYEPGLPASSKNYNVFPDHRDFDLIICNNTLEHVYNPIVFMKELRSLCHPATKVVLSVPIIYTKFISMCKDQWFSNAHIYHFSSYSFLNTCYEAGYGVLKGNLIQEEMGDKQYIILQKITDEVYRSNSREIPKLRMEVLEKTKKFLETQDNIFKMREELIDFDEFRK